MARQLGVGVAESGWAKVFIVELESIANPELIDSIVLESVGGGSNRSPLQAAIDVLQKTRALLVLDCCEHVLEEVGPWPRYCYAAVHPSPLWRRAARRFASQGSWCGPSLRYRCRVGTIPVAGKPSEAARLFVDRARSADAHFLLNEKVLGDVETIVRRVDGIPLAIELAAARIRILSTGEIAVGLR